MRKIVPFGLFLSLVAALASGCECVTDECLGITGSEALAKDVKDLV